MGTIAGNFIVKEEGEQQVASLSNVDVRNFAQQDRFWLRGRGLVGVAGPQGGGRVSFIC